MRCLVLSWRWRLAIVVCRSGALRGKRRNGQPQLPAHGVLWDVHGNASRRRSCSTGKCRGGFWREVSVLFRNARSCERACLDVAAWADLLKSPFLVECVFSGLSSLALWQGRAQLTYVGVCNASLALCFLGLNDQRRQPLLLPQFTENLSEQLCHYHRPRRVRSYFSRTDPSVLQGFKLL